VVRFGVFELDLATGELRKSGLRLRLQDQPFRILAMLLERPGDLVTRDDAGFIPTGPAVLQDGRRPEGWALDRDPFLLESSMPGVFAAGDVRARSVKRIASAVGEGSMAIQFVHQYLATL